MLPVDVPVRLGDGVEIEHPAFALRLDELRRIGAKPLAVDAAVDDAVSDVDARRAELARHRLHDHAKPGLGGREVREAGPSAERAARAREEDRTATDRGEPPRRLAPDEEA